jgi:hypothetical protein
MSGSPWKKENMKSLSDDEAGRRVVYEEGHAWVEGKE